MNIVIDASAAVELALKGSQSVAMQTLLENADVIVAPDTFVSEVTNVFWKYRQFAGFTDEACLKGIEFCIGLVDDFVNSGELWREAFSEAVKNTASAYDMFYFVLARRNSGKVLSVDKKLNQIAEAAGLKI